MSMNYAENFLPLLVSTVSCPEDDLTRYVVDPWVAGAPTVNRTHALRLDKCSLDGVYDSAVQGHCYTKYDSKGYVVYDKYKKCQESPLLLPGWNLLPDWFLQASYFIALVYCFFGIAIISDTFMSAIEVITSKKKTVSKVNDKTGEKETIKVKVWNATVANLTLLALGSSAPEILLSVIETLLAFVGPCKDGAKAGDCGCEAQDPGELGASTIVGSASFNLLAISSICVMCVPVGTSKKIEDFSVFIITSAFSLFAYFWVLIVYTMWTPDVITMTEAFLTLAMFPLLVLIAYGQSQTWWLKKRLRRKSIQNGSDPEEAIAAVQQHRTSFQIFTEAQVVGIKRTSYVADRNEIAKMLKQKAKDHSTDDIKRELMTKISGEDDDEKDGGHEYMKYRINAARQLGGKVHKKSVQGQPPSQVAIFPEKMQTAEDHGENLQATDIEESIKRFRGQGKPVFGFSSRSYAAIESARFVSIKVVRGGFENQTVTVDYESFDGTATSGDDYIAVKGTLTFNPDETSLKIDIPIIDDNQYEPDESFFLRLSNPSDEGAIILKECEITIIDDDDPGVVGFERRAIDVHEIAEKCVINIIRKSGSDGIVSVDFVTADDTAVAGEDYYETKGTVTFEHGEVLKTIEIPLIHDSVPEPDKCFVVELSNPMGGASVSKRSQVIVTVIDDDRVTEISKLLAEALQKKMSADSVETSSWREQFISAVSLEGSVDEFGESIPPSLVDCTFHYISITWKLIFALVPPTDIWNGWATFACSLIMIGVLTGIVGEFATLFGCSVGLKDGVTAISFVALGTSLPDTFASMQAAIESETADAAIGNVTGSNSVNVFLGLGLPWVIATIYYRMQRSEDLHVVSKGLDFSVLIFSIFATICLGTLVFRRFYMGGELGGSQVGRYSTAAFFFLMWVFYIILSALKAYEHID